MSISKKILNGPIIGKVIIQTHGCLPEYGLLGEAHNYSVTSALRVHVRVLTEPIGTHLGTLWWNHPFIHFLASSQGLK